MSKIIICWPESQELMGFDGFRENCSLINGEKGLDTYGSSAYLVDKNWYDEHTNVHDENEDCNDDCELQIAYDTELIELGLLDEDDE